MTSSGMDTATDLIVIDSTSFSLGIIGRGTYLQSLTTVRPRQAPAKET